MLPFATSDEPQPDYYKALTRLL